MSVDNRFIAIFGGAFILIIMIMVSMIALQQQTYIQTTVTDKQFDFGSGRYYIEAQLSPHLSVGVPVSESEYRELDVGECIILTRVSLFNMTTRYAVWGGCP